MAFDQRLLRQAQSVRIDLILTIGLNFLGGIILVGQAFYLSRTISQVFLAGDTLAEVQTWLLLLLGLTVARAGVTWASQITAQRAAGQIKSDLRQRLTERLFKLGPAYASGERTGELTNTLVEGVEALDAYFSQYLPQLATAALIPLTILAFVLPLDLISGLVLLFTAPLIPIFMILIGNLANELTKRQWLSLSRMSAHFLDTLQGLSTLKLFGRSRQQIKTIALISDRFRRTTMSVLRVAFLSALVLELVATISTAIVAVEVGLRLLYGYLLFEQALFVLILAPEFYIPLRLLGTRFHAGIAGVTAAQRIFELLETPPPAASITTPSSATEPDLPPKPAPPFNICFNDVHYVYQDRDHPALNGVSFTLGPGQRIALIGPSGSGKTTIAHLLLRFIDPTQGLITVNGYPLTGLDMLTWRAQLAWISQTPYLFYGSVADNIRLTRPEASMDQIIQAAQQAQAHTFIEALPQAYNTIIGERGSRLSGGQAQRLALARAFLKDAPLLILDEATANLDPSLEDQIQAALLRLMQGQTALIIAHRLNTVYTADKILVLNRGQIVQAETHANLLHQTGLYQQLVAAYRGAT